jgi:hypothetical protein
MKQILALVVALVAVAGCSSSYDYYKGGVRYIQDGKDCVYYTDEYAQHYSESIRGFDGKNRIVYRNTRCEDLFARDHAGQTERNDRKVLTPVVLEKPACTKCTSVCDTEVVPVTRRYYTISAK